jgi:hypothetical protein
VASSAPGLRPLPIPSAACAHVDDGDPSTPVLNAPLPPFLITLPSLLFLAASLLPPSLPSVSRLAWLPPQAELARQRSSSRRPVVDAAVTGSSARHPRRPVRGAPPRSGRRRCCQLLCFLDSSSCSGGGASSSQGHGPFLQRKGQKNQDSVGRWRWRRRPRRQPCRLPAGRSSSCRRPARPQRRSVPSPACQVIVDFI